jgi:hypothetical protein
MDRYDSDPIPLPDPDEDFTRADLVISGLDHSGPSFEGRVYFDNADADESTPRDPASGYAGSFWIFGHGGCYGDEGHCEVPTEPRDPFDYREPHPLSPVTKTVIVTDAVREKRGADAVQVTVVPVVASGRRAKRQDVLHFDIVRLLTYE